MRQYILQRLLLSLLVVLFVSFLTFLILHLLPGDPAMAALGGQAADPEVVEQIREEMGLNDPLYVQYGRFIGGVLQGDLGRSLRTKAPVIDEITLTLPATVKLAIGGMIVALVLGIPLGIIAAVGHNTWLDWLGISVSVLGISIPVFWLGLLLISLFSFQLEWLPAGGSGGIRFVILPSIALGIGGAAIIARMTRSSLLEVFHHDYVRTARAKGIRESRVMNVHVMRNALIPIITIIGLQVGGLLSGVLLVEIVFSRPGIGRLLIQAVQSRDFPLAQALIFLIATFYVLTNLGVDLLYGFLDPRIHHQDK
ncbi:MAG: ABC transporter permease subunit [Anaerolineales bacterium]|nr:ABC transporter permease subunit [Anaerolineales bacterium]